jgi:chromosomal replication initiator protein
MNRPHDLGKIAAIQGLVARAFGLRTEELIAGQRERAVAFPRQIAMYLAKHETGAPLAVIGSHFGGKHHTTVIHAIDRIEALRHSDAATNLAIEIIRNRLASG